MAGIPPVTRDRVREDLRRIFGEVSSGPGGVGTGPMSVLKYSPEMSRRAIPLFNYVRNESSLPQKVRELAMLTTARATGCPYIWNAHAALGRRAGLRDDVVDALRDRKPLAPLSGTSNHCTLAERCCFCQSVISALWVSVFRCDVETRIKTAVRLGGTDAP
ncbi:MAG: carboxymuconolactone decarboxylase family protein [Candidatus Entotheonellia bacterium]